MCLVHLQGCNFLHLCFSSFPACYFCCFASSSCTYSNIFPLLLIPHLSSLSSPVPMNRIVVGTAPSPNLWGVQPKIGSLANASHRPGGGQVNQTLHCNVLHCTALIYTTLHCTAMIYTTLHCTAMIYNTLHYTALHYATPQNSTALHCTALPFIGQI